MNYEEKQAASGLKVGDRVRVTRAAGDYERGWGTYWGEPMNSCIGEISTITADWDDQGFNIDALPGWVFPQFVLEKVEDRHEKLIKSAQKLVKELSTPKNFLKTPIMEEKNMDYKTTDKAITLQNILQETEMCNTWRKILLDDLGHRYEYCDIIYREKALDYAKKHNKLDWLIENGYIVEEKKEITYPIGQFFRYTSYAIEHFSDIFQLVMPDEGKLSLVSKSGRTYFRGSIDRRGRNPVTKKEFDRLGGDTWLGTFTPINVEIKEVP